MIYFIAIILSAVFILILQAKIYRKHAYDKLEYNVSVSSGEVFEGE